MEELISQTFLGENRFQLESQDRMSLENAWFLSHGNFFFNPAHQASSHCIEIAVSVEGFACKLRLEL